MTEGPHACCNNAIVRRGLWSPDEDEKLRNYITRHGHGCWSAVPKLAGLLRCGKSCRLRWINYLRPDLKRGNFTAQEALLIIEIHRVVGNKWAQIAKYLPGRTDNEVKNFWNSSIKKKLLAHREQLVAAAAIQNNNNMLADAQMADPQMNPNVGMHPHTDPNIQMRAHIDPNIQMHPHIEPNIQMHPQMNPNIQMQPQIDPNIQMHPQMDPNIQMHPQINLHVQMHPQSDPNIQMHPQSDPNIQMHTQMNSDFQMHPHVDPNIQMHPQVDPNFQMHPQVEQNIQMHPQVDPNIQMYAQIINPNIQMHPQMNIIPTAPSLPPSPPLHQTMAYDYNVSADNMPEPSANVPPSDIDLQPPYNAPLLDSQILELQEYGMDFMSDGDSGFGDIPPPSPQLYEDYLLHPSPEVHPHEQDSSMHDSVMPERVQPINGLDFNGPPFSYAGQEQVLGFEPQQHINHISNIETLMTSFSASGPSSSSSTGSFGASTSADVLPPEPVMPYNEPFFVDPDVPSMWGPQP